MCVIDLNPSAWMRRDLVDGSANDVFEHWINIKTLELDRFSKILNFLKCYFVILSPGDDYKGGVGRDWNLQQGNATCVRVNHFYETDSELLSTCMLITVSKKLIELCLNIATLRQIIKANLICT
jgi:hypothetical protein